MVGAEFDHGRRFVALGHDMGAAVGENTALGQQGKFGDDAAQGLEVRLGLAEKTWHRGEKALRVGVGRLLKYFLDGAAFHDLAQVHD